jgi:diacylglycerol O-acyltransferase
VGNYDRLGALDASFLHLERLETPMHVGALSVFDGASFFDETGRFRLADARRLVDSRLHLIPRFRRRLMDVPLGQGRPIWVDDDRFDISYHVRLTALPNPGSRDQLLTLCSRIQSGLLDRTRPLWELWFVEGLAGGHVALIQKTHHALVDGVSGVDVATVLLDFSAEPTPVETPEWVPVAPPTSACLLSDSLLERATQPAEMVRTARAAVRGPRRAAASATRIARSMQSMVDRQMVAPRTSLNAPVGRNRRFDTVKVSLDGVKQVRRALGGTVNDVVLAGTAGGLRRLLESRGESVEGLTLKVLCPVSVRDEHEHLALGNRVSAMFVALPVGEPDPTVRLDEIRATTEHLKEAEQAVGDEFLVDLTEYAAPTLLGLGARAAHRQPFFNLIVTNVPGPQVPLYCMGGRMLEAYPVVPLSKNTSIVVGILSYCGQLHFGLFADRDAAADLAVLAAAIEDSFAELEKLAEEAGATTGAAPQEGGS